MGHALTLKNKVQHLPFPRRQASRFRASELKKEAYPPDGSRIRVPP